jgi:hypothetical protein
MPTASALYLSAILMNTLPDIGSFWPVGTAAAAAAAAAADGWDVCSFMLGGTLGGLNTKLELPTTL